MRKLHKGLIIGGAMLAVLVPAGLVAADQVDTGNGQGRGNGSMNHDCTRTGTEAGGRMQLRDGTGPNHAANFASRLGGSTSNAANGITNQGQYGLMDGSGMRVSTG